MKTPLDIDRFARYEAVLHVLLNKDTFQRHDVYETMTNENKAFIGRIINALVRDGYLIENGTGTNRHYAWSKKKEGFKAKPWIDQRVLTAAVKRSPPVDRPRERLLRQGPAALKTSELLAILIRSGLHGESAMQAGEKLAARFGDNLQELSLKAKGELRQISKAIGETAYCQIMAGLELGKRFCLQQRGGSVRPHKVNSPAAALIYCRTHFERLAQEGAQEEFHVVLLDQAHHIMKTAQITVGLTNKSLVHPREVFKLAIQESASALILVHNHPSGDPTPSQEDIGTTKELKAAADVLGLRILDHIILGKDSIVSMVEEGWFQSESP